MLEAHPNTPSQAMGRILQNSADPAPWGLNPGLGFLDHVHRQGAGLIDIDDAILATTYIEPGKLSLQLRLDNPQMMTLRASLRIRRSHRITGPSVQPAARQASSRAAWSSPRRASSCAVFR